MKTRYTIPVILSIILASLIIIATVFLVIIPSVHANDCYGRGGFVVGYLSCASDQDDDHTLPLASEFDGDISIFNRCTPNQICLGNFDNETKVLLSCDIVMHGCGPKNFDNAKEISIIIIPLGATIEGHESLRPEEITVVLGKNNTVSWVNEDDTVHGFTSDKSGENDWATGIIYPNKEISIVFNQTGVFEYHGNPHPWMTGKVIVLEE